MEINVWTAVDSRSLPERLGYFWYQDLADR